MEVVESCSETVTTPPRKSIDDNESDETLVSRSDQGQKNFILIEFLRNITIEPMLFLHLVAYYLVNVLTANLYIDRVCRISLNYTEEVCQPYSHGTGGQKDSDIEEDIQVRVSTLMIYENIIEFAPVVIFALFLGSWCDRYGTKKPMIYAVFGSLVSALILMAITYFPTLRPEFIWLAFIPLGLSGGDLTQNVTAYSYMAKITNEKNRSFRIIALQIFWFLGLPIGTLIGPKIFRMTDFQTVFTISTILYALAIFYGLFFIKEEIIKKDDNDSGAGRASVFSFSSVKDMVTTIFKKRDGVFRRWIILLWLLMVGRVLITTSLRNLSYLFTRQQLGWDAQSFSEFRSIQAFVSIPGNLAVAYAALKIYKLKDQIIGFWSSIGYITSNFIYAFAVKGWMMYLGAGIDMLCGVQLSITRSLLSKLIQPNEIAKAFCFISLTDAALQIPVGTLFNLFYNFTLGFWAGSFYFIHVAIYTGMAFVFGYFIRSMGRTTCDEKSKDDAEKL